MCESNPTNSFSLASSYSTDEKTGLKWSSGEDFSNWSLLLFRTETEI